MIAVCSLGCSRKLNDVHSWDTLTKLDGDYALYINYECQYEPMPVGRESDFLLERSLALGAAMGDRNQEFFLDVWAWHTFGSCSSSRGEEAGSWRRRPKFDQDQARLASIVTARNMCIEFAMQMNCSHLLFIDADIIPPLDIIPKLLEVGKDAVGGLVHGRGDHSGCQYIFGEKRRYTGNGFELVECEHGNIGYTLLSRKLIENIRFRYGVSRYPDGREHMISDDPAYHLDAYLKFGEWMTIRTDVVGRHVGTLKAEEVAQF
jgi:hypothetical protein